ncbi:MAG: type IV pilus biogenesis/stability protein PilW [Woeseiaceae bacterium]
MKKSEKIVLALLVGSFLSGCVSTTTGTPPPEADDDDAAELNYQLGARYYQNGTYELARDRLKGAIELDPRMAKAYTTLGLTYEALDNQRLAREAYENGIRVAPNDFNTQNTYAVYLCRQRDFAGAKKYFEKAASARTNDYSERTLTNAGVCLMQEPDPEGAENFFRKALEIRPTYGEALLQLCLLKYQQQDYLSARAFLQRYMAKNTATAGVLYLAAQIEGKLGNDRGHDEFVDQLLRDFPDSPEARKVSSSG